ncbi:MAG: hypothetical protein ACLT98_16585 [Eggerthellaceae bacterium]
MDEDGEHRLMAAVDRREEQRLTGFGRCVHMRSAAKSPCRACDYFVKDEDFDESRSMAPRS